MPIVSINLSPAAHALYVPLKNDRCASRIISTMMVQRMVRQVDDRVDIRSGCCTTCGSGGMAEVRAGDQRFMAGEWYEFTEDGWSRVDLDVDREVLIDQDA